MTNDLNSEKYVSLITFTKDRRPKSTPVWFAFSEDEKIYIVTDDDSWKIRRIRRDQEVNIAISDSRGNVDESAEHLSGIASIQNSNDQEFEKANVLLTAKYGIYYKFFCFVAKIRRKNQCAIVVNLHSDGSA